MPGAGTNYTPSEGTCWLCTNCFLADGAHHKNQNKKLTSELNTMKKKKGFELRDVCGENIIVASGIENIDFNHIISMNESAVFLWKTIAEEFTVEQLTEILQQEYDVDAATAQKDVTALVKQWKEAGIVE